MKNKLSDLNNHLFEQLERLNDEDLTDDMLAKELKRSSAMSDLATKIIDITNTTIQAQKLILEYNREPANMDVLKEITCKDA